MSAMSALHQEFIEGLSAPELAGLLLEQLDNSNGIEFVDTGVLDMLSFHIARELARRAVINFVPGTVVA